jgi:hypothetical protein
MGLNFDQRSIRLSIVFRQGFMTNVLNPKCALFFLAFPPQFVDADAPSRVLASLFLGLLFDFNGTLWNLFVAWLSARAGTAVRKGMSCVVGSIEPSALCSSISALRSPPRSTHGRRWVIFERCVAPTTRVGWAAGSRKTK